jgi:hypothetical protein
MNSWSKLQEYYKLTDGDHSIYAAATLLYPPLRMEHFNCQWTGEMAHWKPRMRAAVSKVWKDEYFTPAQAMVSINYCLTTKEEDLLLYVLDAQLLPFQIRD